MNEIIIKLTADQIEAVKPLASRATMAAAEGKPGMVLGQILGAHMRVGFLKNDMARLVCKDGETISTALEDDERAWCWQCGAEFDPRGRYPDSDDDAELCVKCETKTNGNA